MESYLSVKEFAQKLKVHPNTVRKYLRNKVLQSIKFTTGPKAHHFIPESEVQRLASIRFDEIVEKEVERRIKYLI